MSEEYSGYFRLGFGKEAKLVNFKIRGTKVNIGDTGWREATNERDLLIQGAKRTGIVFKDEPSKKGKTK